MTFKWGAALLAISTLSTAVEVRPAKRDPLVGRDSSKDVVMMPVVYPTTANKRQDAIFQLKNDLQMEYAEMESYNDPNSETFGATALITTKDPALNTEQFGSAVTNVQCTNNNSIVITFASDKLADQAKSVWNVPAITLITQTPSCNDNDERVPWNITSPQFQGCKVTFSAQQMTWSAASTNFSVGFGGRGYVTNPDAPAQNTTGGVTKRESKDLGWSFDNKVLFTEANGGLTQSCKKCSGTGTATITEGLFNLKAAAAVESVATKAAQGVETAAAVVSSKVENAASEVTKAAEEGWHKVTGWLKERDVNSISKRTVWSDIADHFSDANLEVNLDNFGSSFLFESELDSFQNFAFHLLGEGGVGLPGLQIKKLLRIGPSIDPQLVISANFSEPITFDYGFSFNMPNGAGMSLNFLDPAKSSLNKVQQTTFKALPFSTNVTEAHKGFDVTAIFRAVFSMGVQILDQTIDPIEISLDVPQWDAHVDFKSGVDKKCGGSGDLDALSLDSSFAFNVGIGANVKVMDAVNYTPSIQLFHTSGIAPNSECVPLKTASAHATTTTGGTPKATATKTASSKATTGAGSGAATSKTATSGASSTAATSSGTSTITSAASTSSAAYQYGNGDDEDDASSTADLARRHARAF